LRRKRGAKRETKRRKPSDSLYFFEMREERNSAAEARLEFLEIKDWAEVKDREGVEYILLGTIAQVAGIC